jgi:hypothetical protein
MELSVLRIVQIMASLLLLTGASVAAGQNNALRKGDTVRVSVRSLGGQQLRGVILWADSTSMTMYPSGGATPKDVSFSDVSLLYRKDGGRSQVALGAGIGGIVGFCVGYAIGEVRSSKNIDEHTGNRVDPVEPIRDGIFSGAAGTVIGALVGLTIKTEKWSRVTLPGMKTTVQVSIRGMSVVASINF